MASPDKLCASRAGPFRNIHDENTSSTLLFLFLILSVLITAAIRYLVLGYCLRTLPLPNPDRPAPTPCPRCQHIDGTLLPTSPSPESKPSPEELLAEAKWRMSQTPSIPRFAICATLAILNILAMVLLAFTIQSFLYCGSELTAGTFIANRHQSFFAFAFWLIYVCSAAWASSGILCWAMWVRNLWGGPEAAERWPIRSDLSGIILIGALMAPFILVGLVAMGIVKGLRMCFCGKSLKEAEAVEMESGIGWDSGNVTEEDDGDEK